MKLNEERLFVDTSKSGIKHTYRKTTPEERARHALAVGGLSHFVIEEEQGCHSQCGGTSGHAATRLRALGGNK